jgi:hypothetical protein
MGVEKRKKREKKKEKRNRKDDKIDIGYLQKILHSSLVETVCFYIWTMTNEVTSKEIMFSRIYTKFSEKTIECI